jgi:hypothetical protein
VKVLVRSTVVVLALVVTAMLGPSVAAADSGLDTSFGHEGHLYLELPRTPGVSVFDEERWVTGGDGVTYVLASGSPSPYGTSGPEYLFRFGADGALDRSFGGADHAVVFPKRGRTLRLGVDARGRPLVTSDEKVGEIWRYTKAGHRDPRFGVDGKVVLPRLTGGEVEVKQLPGGGLFAWVEPFEGGQFMTFHLAELSERGRPLRRFGRDGEVNVDVPGEFHLDPVITAGGAVLIGTEGCCDGRLALTRVSALGRLDSRFDRIARHSLGALKGAAGVGGRAEIEATLPLAGGGIRLLGGGFGPGFEMRLRSDGKPTPSFGDRGVEPRPLSIEAAVPVGQGMVLAIEEEQGGHPGVFLIDADGRLDRRFAASPIMLPKKSYYARPTLVGPGRATVTYSHSVGCDQCGRPFLTHFLLPEGPGR